MTNWKKLEDDVADLLKLDNARTTPGSGNSKYEEDVVGKSTISQCKHTDKENISILKKDIDRLKSSAKLLEKLPLFFNRSKNHTTMSLLLEEEYINDIIILINNIILISQLRLLKNKKDYIEDIKSIKNAINIINNIIKQYNINNQLVKSDLKTIKENFENKYMNKIQGNLFEENNK